MLYRLIGFAALASLAGCATTPVPTAVAIAVPQERVIDQSFLAAGEGKSQVIVKRDRGLGGSGCSSRVFVNAKPVADLKPSEKVVLQLEPGEYVFSAWPNGICGGGMSEVHATVKKGAVLSFRIGYGSNGDFTINATAF
jgi:hypothetical protein